MKFIVVISLCLFFGFNVFAQTDGNAAVGIEDISLARGDGNGKAGELTDKFFTTDVPIYCIIKLDSLKSVTVKMNLVAVKVSGMKPETKSVAVVYKTNGNQNQVNFNASPEGIWAAGTYRADVFINNKFVKSRNFEIEKSSTETATVKLPAPKSFAPRKSAKNLRKN